MADDIPVFPVATITAGPIPAYGFVTVKFDFLTNTMQSPSEANPGRHYALMPAQAEYLIAQLQKALIHLESAPPAAVSGSVQ